MGGSGGRQLVPGLLLVGDQTANIQQSKIKSSESTNTTNGNDVKKNNQIGKAVPPQPPIEGVRSKDKLLYLARLMNIQVQFSDFPKANHVMYLTLVSLSTTPPQVIKLNIIFNYNCYEFKMFVRFVMVKVRRQIYHMKKRHSKLSTFYLN